MKKKIAFILMCLLMFIAAVPSVYADSALMKEGESFLDSVPPKMKKQRKCLKQPGFREMEKVITDLR